MAIYRADGFTTLLLYFANKRMFLSKGLVASVARSYWKIKISVTRKKFKARYCKDLQWLHFTNLATEELANTNTFKSADNI